MIIKTSIRYFNNIPIRAIFDYENAKWLYSASDIITALTGSTNQRRYWNTLKSRHNEIKEKCKQVKLKANDGKQYISDVIDEEVVLIVLTYIRHCNKIEFAKWVKGLANPIDEKSRVKAYELFDNKLIDSIEVGTINGLKQIHSFIFDGLYDFAGKIRTKNIAKNDFIFANWMYLNDILANIEKMKEDSFEKIIEKYVEMNIAHPFMEGNGRATRIWLNLILKKRLEKVVDWSLINKQDYLKAMEKSVSDDSSIKILLKGALTDKSNDHEIFMKGIDYSYYYEEMNEKK